MMQSGLLALILLASLETPAQSQEVAAGHAFAERHCALCHAIGRTGNSRHPSAPPFRNIAAKGRVEDLAEALAEGITVGHPDMPEFELTPKQTSSLLVYLKKLSGQ
jgi:mono/diheme cytochrome c family protein